MPTYVFIHLSHVLLHDEGVDDLLDGGHELQGSNLPLVPVHDVQNLGGFVLRFRTEVRICCRPADIAAKKNPPKMLENDLDDFLWYYT